MNEDQIEVNASPLPDQLWAGVRQIAPAALAFGLGKGWISDDLAPLLAALGLMIWPIVAGQLKTRERSQQLTTLARIAPDAVATVKGE